MNEDFRKYLIPDNTDSTAPSQSEDFKKYLVPERTKKEGALRNVGRTIKSVVSPIAGSFGDIQDLLLSLTSKAYGVDPENVKKYLQGLASDDEQMAYLSPTTSEVKETIETAAPSLKPETPGEKTYEETLELASTLANPVFGKVGLGRAALGTAAGMAAKKGAELIGTGETGQELAKNISSIIPLVVSGKLRPTSSESKKLYEAGKRVGLSDKELTPLLVSEKKLGTLGKFAKQSPKITERMQNVESTLGDFYKSIKSDARTYQPYTPKQTENLLSKMEDISHSWKQTLKAAPDKEAAIKYLDESIDNLKKSGASPESLINFYQDINAAVNWRSIKGGKKELSEVKNAVLNSLKESSPNLAKDFESANKMWSKLENFRSKVGWGNLENYISLGEFAPLLYGIASFDMPGLMKISAGIVGAKSARRIATELLTNPSWQSISRNSMKAVEKNSPRIASLAYRQLKSKVKSEFPEDYKEIKWPK
jgi:hypothetical protein